MTLPFFLDLLYFNSNPTLPHLYQASFDYVKVGPTPVLALHNLWRQIYIFLDILECRVKNKIFFSKLFLKLLQTKYILKYGLSWGKLCPLRTLWHNLHMVLDIFECRVEKKTKKMFRDNCFENVGLEIHRKN